MQPSDDEGILGACDSAGMLAFGTGAVDKATLGQWQDPHTCLYG